MGEPVRTDVFIGVDLDARAVEGENRLRRAGNNVQIAHLRLRHDLGRGVGGVEIRSAPNALTSGRSGRPCEVVDADLGGINDVDRLDTHELSVLVAEALAGAQAALGYIAVYGAAVAPDAAFRNVDLLHGLLAADLEADVAADAFIVDSCLAVDDMDGAGRAVALADTAADAFLGEDAANISHMKLLPGLQLGVNRLFLRRSHVLALGKGGAPLMNVPATLGTRPKPSVPSISGMMLPVEVIRKSAVMPSAMTPWSRP